MTSNQIAYWNLEELKRSNAAKEGETRRSNLAREAETSRHNVAQEYIDKSRVSVERGKAAETARHNVKTETQSDYLLPSQKWSNVANIGGSVVKGITSVIPFLM